MRHLYLVSELDGPHQHLHREMGIALIPFRMYQEDYVCDVQFTTVRIKIVQRRSARIHRSQHFA